MIEQNGNLTIGLTLQMSVGYSSDVPRISCTQTDNKSITVAVRMMDKSKPYLVPDKSEVNLRAKKPDGKAVYCPLTRDENGFSFELGGQLTTAVGVVQAAVEVSSGDFVLSSAQFEIEVKPRTVEDDDIISDGDITTILGRIDSQVVQSVADYFTENPVKDGEPGPQGEAGFGVAAVVQQASLPEEIWSARGEEDSVIHYSGTESLRNGCRIGDIFSVTGTATDTGNGHVLWYRSAADSGNLAGICIGHTVTMAGEKGDKGDRGDPGGVFTETVTEITMSIPVRSSASDFSSASVDYTPVYEGSIIVLDIIDCVYNEAGDLYGMPVVFSVLPKYANLQKVEGVKSITAIRMGKSTAPIDITLKVHEIKC